MAQQLMETPNVPLNFVPAKAGEVLHLGTIIIRIMEDGSRTGTAEQAFILSLNMCTGPQLTRLSV